MSNSLFIDVTAALKNCDKEYPLNFNIELAEILPYVDSVVSSCSFNGFCMFTNPDIEIYGKIQLEFSALCDRCGTSFSDRLQIDFDQVFHREQHGNEYTYSKNRVDVAKAISDEILLSIPSVALCKKDCLGVCFRCGCNLNNGSCGCEK